MQIILEEVMAQAILQSQPPGLLKLLSHPIRWRLLQALSHSDLRVQELVQQLRRPQNLVSYHLKLLRKGQIVHERRSLADARDIYYSLDVERVRDLYFASGEALHPVLDIRGRPSQDFPLQPVRVLFLCTHNSARSQMAEAILRSQSKGQLQVFSAGTQPTGVHPLAVRAMAEMDIDIQHHRSKSLVEFLDRTFEYIITVCDRAREACPVFPGDPERIHWSFPDPADVEGPERKQFHAFQETAVQLNTRITYLLLMIQREQARSASLR
jgi:protein-tyrosine-phosphatase/DNA-binding transcriptional ArsR family regulator